MAPWIRAFWRATTANPTLRARHAITKSVQPAESARTWTGRGPWPGRRRAGARRRSRRGADRSRVEHREVIGDRVRGRRCRAATSRRASRRSRPRNRTSDGTRTRPCSSAPSLLVLGVDLDQRRVDVQHHRPSPVVDRRVPHPARTSPIASHNPPRVDRVDLTVTCDTTSSPTAPARTVPACARRCSISAHASPPPASINIACTSTFPGHAPASRSPADRIRADNASPSPSRSANRPNACSPTCATTRRRRSRSTTATVLLPCTCQVPFSSASRCVATPRMPYGQGTCRAGRQILRSPPVNDRG